MVLAAVSARTTGISVEGRTARIGREAACIVWCEVRFRDAVARWGKGGSLAGMCS